MLKIKNVNYKNVYKILPFLIANTVVFTGCTGTINDRQNTGVEKNITTTEDLSKPDQDECVTVKVKVVNLECMRKGKEKEKIILLRQELNQLIVGISVFPDGYISVPEVKLVKGAHYQISFDGNLTDIVAYEDGETLIIDFSNYTVSLSEKEEKTYTYL